MEEKIHQVPFGNEFRICPLCGYKDGFHTMLKKEKDKANQDRDQVRWLFICPSCSEIFDIGRKLD